MTWNAKQRTAARLLAMGLSKGDVAARVDVDAGTMSEWVKDPHFEDYCEDVYAVAWKRIEPAIMANVELALDLQKRVFLGEVKASDPSYRDASKLITRILDRLLTVEPTHAAIGAPDSPVLIGGDSGGDSD